MRKVNQIHDNKSAEVLEVLNNNNNRGCIYKTIEGEYYGFAGDFIDLLNNTDEVNNVSLLTDLYKNKETAINKTIALSKRIFKY